MRFLDLTENPMKLMKAEAVTASFYESQMWNRRYPKIQLLTVADLLAGKQIDMPPRPASRRHLQESSESIDQGHGDRGTSDGQLRMTN
jgi:site-specific DNA-methyltransferase (adenine-specific)